MNKKLFLFLSSLISISLVIASCSLIRGGGLGGGVPGSRNVQTETRDIGAFEAVSIEYPQRCNRLPIASSLGILLSFMAISTQTK